MKPTTRPAGIVCPIVTPLTAGEHLDVAAYHRLLERVLPHVDGILVLGSSGEFILLREEVARHTVEVTVDYVQGRVPIYVGVGDTGTVRVLQKLAFTAASGADYVLVTSPFYYATSDQETLARHFLTVADASELPVLVYNIPQNTHIPLSTDLAARLAAHPNIVGLKDSQGDMFQFQEFLALKDENFSVFQGREQLAAASLWLGADGIVSTLSNFAPERLQHLISLVREGKREEAIGNQRAITRLATLFDQGYWVSAAKVALEMLAITGARTAQGLPQCTDSQKERIRRILQEAGLLSRE